MLVRRRMSRIYYLRQLFNYPIQLNLDTLSKLGFVRTMRIGFSYLRTMIFPPKSVVNLEQFFISRFGRELYLTFFKSYTERVWGVPCDEISAEWGQQRIKGLSISKALLHFMKSLFRSKADVAQKDVETSLIEQFLYPKYGPGQMWEIVAEKIRQMGGEILTGIDVRALRCENGKITAVSTVDAQGHPREFEGDYFFSSMPVKELVQSLDGSVPANVREVSDGLLYRDFLDGWAFGRGAEGRTHSGWRAQGLDDNWIYVQEPDVRWADCRFSITGVRIWSRQPRVSGWELNISATNMTNCGTCPMRK